MKIHVLTLFPEMITGVFTSSIIGRAAQKELISLNAVNIRDYTLDKHKKVDDYPYGGGAGMLMQAQPVFDAWKDVARGDNIRTIYVTPQGMPFNQSRAQELAGEDELIFLCGHYEGVDERVLEEIVTDRISLGDYILTGGELPAMVMIDAIARLIPGVLGNDNSAEEESFFNDLLEYPQYSRPEVWHNIKVPEVLLSGDHRKIAKWRLEQSLERTEKNRPDLYAKYERKQRLIQKLLKAKRDNIHMIESLSRGRAEILFWEGDEILLYDKKCGTCMVSASSEKSGKRLLALAPKEARSYVASQAFWKKLLCEDGEFAVRNECYQWVYTRRTPLSVRCKEIRKLTLEQLDYVVGHCDNDDAEYVEERIREGAMYGAFVGERQVGFIGTHIEGGLGLLYVEETYRRQGIASSLEAYVINRTLEKGWTPYGHVITGNDSSSALQEKLGLYRSGQAVWRIERNPDLAEGQGKQEKCNSPAARLNCCEKSGN